MKHDFSADYEELGLDQRADWTAARAAYRRAVNRWHPDRFAGRPQQQRADAERRFIRLTRAFDNLRTFHRAHRHLPFEPLPRPAPRPQRPARRQAPAPARSPGRPNEAAVRAAGVLGPRTTPRRRDPRQRRLHPLWALAGVSAAVATIALFVLLDRHARHATLAEGREVLRRSGPSEFMPSATEVQRRSARGIFVEGEQGERIGDRLIDDAFR